MSEDITIVMVLMSSHTIEADQMPTSMTITTILGVPRFIIAHIIPQLEIIVLDGILQAILILIIGPVITITASSTGKILLPVFISG